MKFFPLGQTKFLNMYKPAHVSNWMSSGIKYNLETAPVNNPASWEMQLCYVRM